MRPRQALDRKLDRQPNSPNLLDQLPQSLEPGLGPERGLVVGPRNSPSIRRNSVKRLATRARDRTNASRARSGSRPKSDSPASACTTIVLTLWATTSCSSRARRARSRRPPPLSCRLLASQRLEQQALAARDPSCDPRAPKQDRDERGVAGAGED